MGMNRFEKTQIGVGCAVLAVWLFGVGLSVTICVLLIRALLKYIGS